MKEEKSQLSGLDYVYGYIICIVQDKMFQTLDVQDSSGNFCGLYDISVWDCSLLDYSQCGAVFTTAVYLTTVLWDLM